MIHKTVNSKLKIEEHEPHKNIRGELRCSGRVQTPNKSEAINQGTDNTMANNNGQKSFL
jgi:hypothetical protein